MNTSQFSLRHYGDNAVLVEWAVSGFDEAVSNQVHGLAALLRDQSIFTEIMPGYDSLVASFDLAELSEADAKDRVAEALSRLSASKTGESGQLIEIPVNYGGEDGPDLETLSAAIGKSPEEVIQLHSGREYRVCMMGFIPGFAFLSEVDPVLQHPRHETPRAVVPAGSVGIANWQTGIYGLESPGGWQIIGRTNSVMFDPTRDEPFLAKAGDRIRFVPQ